MMTNKTHIKAMSLMLTLWYMIAVVGINIHTCATSGLTYVSPLPFGMSCSEIHHDIHCCDHHDGCCSNDVHKLQLSGSDDTRTTNGFSMQIAVNLTQTIIQKPVIDKSDIRHIYAPVRLLIQSDITQLYAIWRI